MKILQIYSIDESAGINFLIILGIITEINEEIIREYAKASNL